MTIHFLHIGKCGGTAIKHALKETKLVYGGELVLHPHSTSLNDVPHGDKVVFFLRDPIRRFYSGFYSRLRKGMPRYHFEWTEMEKRAFAVFNTPDELIKACISAPDSVIHTQGLSALRSIQHVRDHYPKWLSSVAYLQSRKSDLLFIGFQETLESDFDLLLDRLKVTESSRLPTSANDSHKNPPYEISELDIESKQFLESWYSADYELYRFCQQLKSSL